MMLSTRAERGGHVWTNVGEPELWLLSKVLLVGDKTVKVEVIGNDFDDKSSEHWGEVLETTNILGFDRLQLEDWDDALRMSGELNEASLLQLLRRRFFENKIYTFLGDVLISINPYKDVGALTASGMPSPDELEENEKEGTVVPHLHVVSERAHRNMLTHGPRGTSQSILINGESGSGKTEAAKCIMKCLAQRSFAKRQVLKKQASAGLNNSLKRMGVFGSAQLENRGVALLGSKGRGRGAGKMLNVAVKAELDGSEDVEDAGSKVERSFILANPLLEAFGNAKTVNNHNSSRFGKFVKIEYDDDGCIVGANTRAFFLEKSRLVRRALGERNFHSFYQLLNAHRQGHEIFTEEQFKELEAFHQREPVLLKASSNVDNRQEVDSDEDEDDEAPDMFNEDLEAFNLTNKSMEIMGLDEEERIKVWKTISLILAIGELEFATKILPDKKDNLERSTVTRYLDVVSGMLSMDANVLELALCQRSVRAGKRGSVTYTPLSPVRARESNEGLAKALYNCLFSWLVERINEASREAIANVQKSRRKDPLFIGVLDIFGFEVLRTNSFEQLCINYANEVMQHFFDQHVFELEHSIYKEEGVDSSKFTFRDNTPIINLLSGKPSGIFRVLDEQGMMGDAATDVNFLQKIDTAHRASTEYYRARPILHMDGLFEVKHFAGAVIYDVREFIAKNKDILEPDLAELLTGLATTSLEGSLARFVGQMYVDIHGEKDPSANMFKQETTSNRRLTTLETVSGRFRSQMSDLSVILEATDQNFIRCVKPNRVKKPEKWDAPLVLNQLKYLSVMEMVRIRTEGFPVRIPFPDLVAKFPELLKPTGFSWYPGTNDKRACETMLRSALGRDSEQVLWVSGATKCFLRDGVMEILLNMVRDMKTYAALQMQKLWRGYVQWRKYHIQRKAAITIQRWFALYCKTKPPSPGECATKIQTMIRARLARKEAEKRLKAIVEIQRFRRKLRKERRARRMRMIIKIQAWFRMQRCLRQFLFFRMQVVRFQAMLRGVFVRGRYQKVLESRQPWKEFLSPNEAVVLTSLVIKTSDVHGVRSITKNLGSLGNIFSSKKHRQLIFTTGPGVNELDPQSSPRLFYVDPVSRTWKGEIPYDTGLTCGLTVGDKDFLVYSKQNDDKQDKVPVWTFTDLLGPAVCWIRSIRRNVSVLELVRDYQPAEFHTRVPPSQKGPLMMRQLVGPKKYLDYLFTLVGTDLWWIENPGQTTPSGGVNLTASCNVRIIENPRQIPFVPEYAFWLDTPCRVKPLKFRTNDPETMKAWVIALERAIKKCRDDEATKNDPLALADRIYQSGCALFDASNFLGAKIKFKDALDLVRTKGRSRVEANAIEFDCLEHRARCNFVLGLYEKALEDSTSALMIKPGNESCMRTRAAAFEKLNRFQESLDEYDKLVGLAPWANDLKVLREKVLRSMEIMKGRPAAAPALMVKNKAPAIARQPSREFLKEGSRSGLLALPVDTTSPSHSVQMDRKLQGFRIMTTKRRMEEDEEEGGPSMVTKKQPPLPPQPKRPLETRISGEARQDADRRSSSSVQSSSGDQPPIVKSKPVPPAIPPSRPAAPSAKAPPGKQSAIGVTVEEDLVSDVLDETKTSSTANSATARPFLPPDKPMVIPPPPPPPPLDKPKIAPPVPPPGKPVSAAAVPMLPPDKPSPAAPQGKKPERPVSSRTVLMRATSAPTPGAPGNAAATSSTTTPSPAASPGTSPAPSPKLVGAKEIAPKSASPSENAPTAVGSSPPAAAAADRKPKKRQSSGSGSIEFARAIADYIPDQSTKDQDLELRKGDEIVVVHKFKDGWWKGSLNGKQGLFPSTFVKLIDIRETKGIIASSVAKAAAVGDGSFSPSESSA